MVGAAGFIGYLIWLVVCIRNWDSKIPPVIGMILSMVMLFGGLEYVAASGHLEENGPTRVSAEQEAPKEEVNEDAAPNSEDSPDGSQGIWYVDYYLDNFRQPTDQWYITAPVFSGIANYGTTDAEKELSVEVRVDCYGEIAFLLYIYNGTLIGTTYSNQNEEYNITMRTSEGTDYAMTGTLYSGDSHLCIDEEYKRIVLEAMRTGKNISFYIEHMLFQPENYLFSIDAEGFDSVYQAQTGD